MRNQQTLQVCTADKPYMPARDMCIIWHDHRHIVIVSQTNANPNPNHFGSESQRFSPVASYHTCSYTYELTCSHLLFFFSVIKKMREPKIKQSGVNLRPSRKNVADLVLPRCIERSLEISSVLKAKACSF